jgi:plasmid stabilization system protein ParE
MRYRLTDAAKADVREMVQWIRQVQKSPQNARLVANRLKAQFSQLVETPYLGHGREELHDDCALVIEVTGLLVIYDRTLKPLRFFASCARSGAWAELPPAAERIHDPLSGFITTDHANEHGLEKAINRD